LENCPPQPQTAAQYKYRRTGIENCICEFLVLSIFLSLKVMLPGIFVQFKYK
jgi:hypothetical protein